MMTSQNGRMPVKISFTIRKAQLADMPAITDIYNEAVLTTTSSFDLSPRTIEDRTKWFESHDERHPVLVAIVDGDVAGWASLTRWSDKGAYADTAETSFFVRSAYRGRGIAGSSKRRSSKRRAGCGFTP